MTELSRGVQYSRIVLCILNILSFIFGIAVMTIGIFIKINGNFNAISQIYEISESFGGEAIQGIATGMIVVGVFGACLAALGFIGAIHEKQCFLYMHAVFLILILVFEFATLIIILVFRQNIWQTYDSEFLELFKHAYRHNDTKTIKIIEKIEREFQCCGVQGPSDYSNKEMIPLSCRPYQSIIYHPFYQGCAQAVVDWFWNEIPIIAGILGTIFFLELFGLVCSLILGVAISTSKNSGTYKEI